MRLSCPRISRCGAKMFIHKMTGCSVAKKLCGPMLMVRPLPAGQRPEGTEAPGGCPGDV